MIKAVIFDMDGVIIDSEPYHIESDGKMLKEFGIELEDKVLEKYIGVSTPTMWAELKETYNLDYSMDEILRRQLEYKLGLFGQKGLGEIEGISELISTFKEKGLKIGLASSSPMELIELILGRLGIIDCFDVIVSGEEVPRSKPAPDIFLEAASLLGVTPDECLVVEDSEHGVRAAKSAGMICIGYINPNSGNQNLSLADVILDSIKDVSVEIEALDLS